jgi:transposase
MKMSDATVVTAGIDASKSTLDMAIHGRSAVVHVPNTTSGWKQLADTLGPVDVARVGIEATGGYERGVMGYLRRQGITVTLLQPAQVKAFGMLHLRRAKTDRIDAALIAACTHVLGDQGRMAPDVRFEALGDHLTYIEQIEEDVARLKTRLEHIADRRLRRQVSADVRRLQMRRLVEIKRLAAAVCAYEDLGARHRLALSVPAVGERTALALVIRMPELGHATREEVASLAGLAPFVRQSGKWKGETHIGGGRGRLRRSLYAAAFPGAHHRNPALVALKTRMMARGASHTSAIVACARKLLIQVNAVIARGTPWEEARPAHA